MSEQIVAVIQSLSTLLWWLCCKGLRVDYLVEEVLLATQTTFQHLFKLQVEVALVRVLLCEEVADDRRCVLQSKNVHQVLNCLIFVVLV